MYSNAAIVWQFDLIFVHLLISCTNWLYHLYVSKCTTNINLFRFQQQYYLWSVQFAMWMFIVVGFIGFTFLISSSHLIAFNSNRWNWFSTESNRMVEEGVTGAVILLKEFSTEETSWIGVVDCIGTQTGKVKKVDCFWYSLSALVVVEYCSNSSLCTYLVVVYMWL